MKFAFGILALVNDAMCMQMSVQPTGDLELLEDGDLDFVQDGMMAFHHAMASCDDDPCGTEFNLNGHNPVNNNLGGKGPEQGPEEIRFKNAACIKSQSVDLVMKTTSEYTPGMTPNTGNGAANGFGSVTLWQGTDVGLELALVDSSSGAPVNVDEFTIWVYDIDAGKRGRGKESVKACGAVVTAMDNSKPSLEKTTDGDCTTYAALEKGTKKDNPTDRNALSDEAKRRVISATWSNANKANLQLALAPGGEGRGFQFTATAKTLCTTTTTTPPYSTPKPQPVDPDVNCQNGNDGGKNCSLDEVCKQGVEMQFFKHNIIHNNLAGLGPQFDHPPVLQYTNVAEHHGRSLDLIVSASSNYKTGNWNYCYYGHCGRAKAAAYNGVAGGGAGAIFSMAPLKFDVTFKLVWTDTQEPAVIPYWMMTYYDLDGNYESVGTCDADSVATFKNTAMQGPGCSGGCCQMKGARAEYKEPPSWDSLADYYKQPAVTFVLKDTSQGTFTYENTYIHRMWFFKGSKALACGE